MNVSVSWLNKYVGTDLSTQEICDLLTITGTKVEKIDTFGVKVEKVVTGRIENIKQHKENADLKVLTINVGNSIVTAIGKIEDIQIGDITAVALEGAKTKNKYIKSANIEGVVSNAMIVHIAELGLENSKLTNVKESGLIYFDNTVELGADVSNLLKLGEEIIEFEITPNRPDCLGVEGIAKELAAATYKKFNDIYKESKKLKDFKVDNIDGITTKVDTENCFRYMLKIVKNVKIAPSPLWLQLKLAMFGIRPINNIVDITNYVMITYGQPLHAFDSSRIKGNKIIVRQATNDEDIKLLDDTTKKLTTDDMIIADEFGPIAIAGVMGGEYSGINENTTTVAIESATFKRGNVRLSAKRHGIRTDASSRYEKGLPQSLTEIALAQVVSLIEALGAGEVVEGYIDIYPNKQEENNIEVKYKYFVDFLGTDISKEEVNEILSLLEIKIENINENTIIATPPYYRQDILAKEDLAEEVARIYGYEKLNSLSYNGEATVGLKTKEQKLEDKLKLLTLAEGYNEIYTYTFFNNEDLDRLNIPVDSKLRECIEIINPLSSEFSYLRTSIVPSMLEALDRNYSKKNTKVKLYELGKIFTNKDNIFKKGKLPKEELILSIGMFNEEYKTKNKSEKFLNIKQTVEKILKGLKINTYDIERYEESSIYHPGQSAKILVDGQIIAVLGKVHPKVTKNYNIPEDTYIAEISFDEIKNIYNDSIKYVEIPKFPAVERDLAFVVKEDMLSNQIENLIKSVDEKLIEKVKLFDIYQGTNIEEGYKSMAYSIQIRDKEKTLTSEEIDNIMQRILNILQLKCNAQIRK